MSSNIPGINDGSVKLVPMCFEVPDVAPYIVFISISKLSAISLHTIGLWKKCILSSCCVILAASWRS